MFAANDSEDLAIALLTKHKVVWQEIEGCYKGVRESSFLVIDTGAHVEHLVRFMSKLFKQECYLELDQDRNARLVYQDSVAEIGILKGVSKPVAFSKDAWSYSPVLDQYYVIEERL